MFIAHPKKLPNQIGYFRPLTGEPGCDDVTSSRGKFYPTPSLNNSLQCKTVATWKTWSFDAANCTYNGATVTFFDSAGAAIPSYTDIDLGTITPNEFTFGADFPLMPSLDFVVKLKNASNTNPPSCVDVDTSCQVSYSATCKLLRNFHTWLLRWWSGLTILFCCIADEATQQVCCPFVVNEYLPPPPIYYSYKCKVWNDAFGSYPFNAVYSPVGMGVQVELTNGTTLGSAKVASNGIVTVQIKDKFFPNATVYFRNTNNSQIIGYATTDANGEVLDALCPVPDNVSPTCT